MICNCDDPAPSDFSIDGRPTFTFDRSRIVSAATAMHTANACQRERLETDTVEPAAVILRTYTGVAPRPRSPGGHPWSGGRENSGFG